MEIIKIKIIKCTSSIDWYYNRIGEIYLVVNCDADSYKVVDTGISLKFINKSDCEIIKSIATEPKLENISLRDYFAARAMQSYLINNAITKNNPNSSYESYFTESEIADYSYNLADAMLKAREVTQHE